ncbi:MAG: septum formation family protein [Actinomycetota bacterium]
MSGREWVPTGRVIGRWGVDEGRPLHGAARLHGARPLGDDSGPERLLEVHPVDPAEADAVVADIRRAAAITGTGLVTILDVGRTRIDETEVVYVVTTRWDELLGPTAFDDDELVTLARSLARGLATLHRSGLTHGAIHRQAVRRIGGDWQLAPAGLGPVADLAAAPYRPPGLHVVEPPSSAADMWSLGVLVHELGAGYLLRPGETPRLPGLPRSEQLAQGLVVADPGHRLTADQVVSGDIAASTVVAEPGSATGGTGPGAGPGAGATVDVAPPLYPYPTPDPPPGPAPSPHPPVNPQSGATPAPGPVSSPPGEPVAHRVAPAAAHPPAGQATTGPSAPTVTSGAGGGGSSRLPLLLAAGVAALIVVVGLAVVLAGGDDPDATTDAIDTAADNTAADNTAADGAAVDGSDGADAEAAVTSTVEPGATDEGAPDEAEGGQAADESRPTTGPMAVADLLPGDCVDVNLALGLNESVELVPCEQPHTAEVIGLVAPDEADGEEYPGRVALQGAAIDECLNAFTDYVGANPFRSSLAPVAIPPTFTEWDSGGRRETICLVNLFDSTDLTESVADRGSAYRVLQGDAVPLGLLPAGDCFATDGIETFGKRQLVEAVSCNNPHRYEIISLEALPLPEEELAKTILDANVIGDRGEELVELCRSAWEELTAPPGMDEPAMLVFAPDEYDWQLGDRFMLCIAEWTDPVISSAVVYDLTNG